MRRNATSTAERNGHPTQNVAVLPPETLGRLCGSLKQQFKRYRKQLRRCQKEFSEKAVHASRVETRRLLSVVELLEPFISAAHERKIRRALKRHLDIFDRLRDTQVQLPVVAQMRKPFPAARKFHSHLKKCEARFSKQTRRAIKRVKIGRPSKLVEACRRELAKQLKQSDPELTAAMLWRSVNRAFVRVGRLKTRIHPRDTRSIHCTRIAFKKFRYMLESLSKCWPVPGKALLSQMHDYQTLMGDIQDAEVLLQAFDKCRERSLASRRFRQELVKRRNRLIRRFLERSGQLSEFWPLSPSGSVARAPRNGKAKLQNHKSSIRAKPPRSRTRAL